MIITASRKDDILKRKAQYESNKDAYDKRQQEYSRAYHEAEHAALAPIEEYLERKLSRYSALTFEIDARRGWGTRTRPSMGAEVFIRCNERNKFDDNVALAWSYDVKLDSDGNVVRETSSWSGLSATTEDQMQSLRQTVAALEFLNDVDWEELINIDMPNYSDYYNRDDKAPEREDFESQLMEASIEDMVGQDKYIQVRNWGESCPYRGDVWLKILKDTGKMYVANVIPGYMIKDWKVNPEQYINAIKQYSNYAPYRIRKSSIKLTNPIAIATVDNNTITIKNEEM